MPDATTSRVLRLRVVREAQGKSLEDVSAASGVDVSYLSRVERGLQQPSVRTLAAILRALSMTDSAEAIERVLEPVTGESLPHV